MIRKAVCFLMVSFAVACGDGPCKVASTGPWVPFVDPYGDGGINTAATLKGRVSTCSIEPGTTVSLAVSGVEPNRMYGAHVHQLPCGDGAGGHYRDNPDAGATATNEVWLDFLSDARGSGAALATATWQMPPGARSVIIHDHATGAGGAAGAKLTCIDVAF